MLEMMDLTIKMIEKECVHAEYAVSIVGEEFAQIFENMDDEYMRARSLDVKDISKRVIRILTGTEEVDFSQIPASIIVAEDLTPSETIQMDKSKLLGFVTVRGSSNSHTAILARMMNIRHHWRGNEFGRNTYIRLGRFRY